MLEAVLEFIIRFLEAIAWPLVVFLLVYIFRANLEQLLNRISRFSYKELQVELRENLDAAERESKSIVVTPAPVGIDWGTSRSIAKISGDEAVKSEAEIRMALIRELAENSPRSAVMLSWNEVELATFEVAKALSVPVQDRRRVDKIVGKLVERSIINESLIGVYNRLHNLRNKVFHADDASISQDDAETYVKLALELVCKLRIISQGNQS